MRRRWCTDLYRRADASGDVIVPRRGPGKLNAGTSYYRVWEDDLLPGMGETCSTQPGAAMPATWAQHPVSTALAYSRDTNVFQWMNHQQRNQDPIVPVTPMDVAARLRALGLGQCEPVFRDNGIDARVLPTLTAEDLSRLAPRDESDGLAAQWALQCGWLCAVRRALRCPMATSLPIAPPGRPMATRSPGGAARRARSARDSSIAWRPNGAKSGPRSLSRTRAIAPSLRSYRYWPNIFCRASACWRAYDARFS